MRDILQLWMQLCLYLCQFATASSYSGLFEVWLASLNAVINSTHEKHNWEDLLFDLLYFKHCKQRIVNGVFNLKLYWQM